MNKALKPKRVPEFIISVITPMLYALCSMPGHFEDEWVVRCTIQLQEILRWEEWTLFFQDWAVKEL